MKYLPLRDIIYSFCRTDQEICINFINNFDSALLYDRIDPESMLKQVRHMAQDGKVGDIMKKIKFMANAANGVVRIPKRYQKALSGKIEITVEQDERAEIFNTIVDRNLKKYSKALEKLAKN